MYLAARNERKQRGKKGEKSEKREGRPAMRKERTGNVSLEMRRGTIDIARSSSCVRSAAAKFHNLRHARVVSVKRAEDGGGVEKRDDRCRRRSCTCSGQGRSMSCTSRRKDPSFLPSSRRGIYHPHFRCGRTSAVLKLSERNLIRGAILFYFTSFFGGEKFNRV